MAELENGQYKLNVEGRLSTVETMVDEMRTNHLPHIQAEITAVKSQLDRLLWLVVTGVTGIMINLGMKLLEL